MIVATVNRFVLTSLSFAFLASFSLISCGPGNEKTDNRMDSKESAEEHNEAKFNSNAEKDAQFLVDAATINLEEIHLGDLASSKGVTNEVKEMGKALSAEHSKLQAELSNLAKEKGITIPTTVPESVTKKYNNLNSEASIYFDKEYASMMVEGHKEAISTFESAATNSEDADIRDWASKMLPLLRSHLDEAMNCENKLSASK